MDREQWHVVLSAIKRAARKLPHLGRLTYPDWLIAAMYFWALAHDRCQSWACDKTHYGAMFRPRKLPSVSQFNRRIASDRCLHLLQMVHQLLAGPIDATALSYLDGKPLPVGGASKDPDARRGRVIGGAARGYKLHAWVSEDRRIPLWSLTPLNLHESHVAISLLQQGPPLSQRSLILGDGNYDDHKLHRAAAASGARLLTTARGLASHPVTLRQMGSARREHVRCWKDQAPLLRMVLGKRMQVEITFAHLCAGPGGLAPLPPWVRRLGRVRRWVGGKIILYHARWRARRHRETVVRAQS
jgi:hypothetical protein